MILAAADPDGILLRRSQPRYGFAGVEDAARRVLDERGVAMRCRRGGRQQLQEIECRPFAGEERASRPCNPEEELVGDHRIALGGLPVDPHGGVQLGEHGVDIGRAA